MKTKFLLFAIIALLALIASLLVYIFIYPSINIYDYLARENQSKEVIAETTVTATTSPASQIKEESQQLTEEEPEEDVKPQKTPEQLQLEKKYQELLEYGIKPREADYYEQE